MPTAPWEWRGRFGLPVQDLRVDCVYERTALTHHLDDGTRITIIQKVRGHARRDGSLKLVTCAPTTVVPPPHCHWIR